MEITLKIEKNVENGNNGNLTTNRSHHAEFFYLKNLVKPNGFCRSMQKTTVWPLCSIVSNGATIYEIVSEEMIFERKKHIKNSQKKKKKKKKKKTQKMQKTQKSILN